MGNEICVTAGSSKTGRAYFFDQTTAPLGFFFGVTQVVSIEIIFDEGTDTPSPDGNAPAGVGLATIDNIRINNTSSPGRLAIRFLPYRQHEAFCGNNSEGRVRTARLFLLQVDPGGI